VHGYEQDKDKMLVCFY